MKRFLQVANIFSVVFAIVMNWLVATSEELPGIKNASDEVATFLTPASYVFSIWTLIYILITLLALYQARDFFRPKKQNVLPKRLSFYFILANIGNGLWTFVFVAGSIGLSLFVILVILFSLLMLIKRLRVALDDESFSKIIFVAWPILSYAGWVFIASVVNAASLYASFGNTLSAFASVGILLGVAVILSLLLWRRNARVFVLASTWGITGIVVAQYGENALVWISALIVALFLTGETCFHFYRYFIKKRKKTKRRRKIA